MNIAGFEFPDVAHDTYERLAYLVRQDNRNRLVAEIYDGDGAACPNCNDNRVLNLKLLSQPARMPLPIRGVTWVSMGEWWYRAQTYAFECPLCKLTDGKRLAIKAGANDGH